MSVLVRELLLDASLNRLPIDTHSDLIVAVQIVLTSGICSERDINIFDFYLSGYTATEIAHMLIMTTEEINNILARLFTAIEETSGYTDDLFIQKLERQRYRRSGIDRMKVFLKEQSLCFDGHGDK